VPHRRADQQASHNRQAKAILFSHLAPLNWLAPAASHERAEAIEMSAYEDRPQPKPSTSSGSEGLGA
jgi:hypothetical protein